MIETGLKKSILYSSLGKKYRFVNLNQSYLCFENALYHYQKEVKEYHFEDAFFMECKKELGEIKKQPQFAVKKTAIIVLSYNNLEITKNCIESIRQNNYNKTYELIVVDNASTDGVQDWLRKQKDICFIENKDNMGFPYGCNQGIAAAGESYDIMLLNNDTIVPEDALFWLRMGLYENDSIGAAGSVSNHAVNYQNVLEQFSTVDQWMEFAKKNNVLMEQPYEKKSWLMGFAMLIKRTALEAVMRMEKEKQKGGVPREVLDLRFSPGNFEDNDLGIRLLQADYQMLLVKNSFIFHYGGKAFQITNEKYGQLMNRNKWKMEEKYGFDFMPYFNLETALIDGINPDKEGFNVLEVGCGLGIILARIESMYPQANVIGLEKNKYLAKLAANVAQVRNQDFLIDYVIEQKYDYIIFDESLYRNQARKMLQKAKRCLAERGTLLIAFLNAQCVRENCQMKENSFRLDEFIELCIVCQLEIKVLNYRFADLSQAEEQKVLQLCENEKNSRQQLYRIEKFVLHVS